jgi:hypothetical protein
MFLMKLMFYGKIVRIIALTETMDSREKKQR